MQDAPTAAAAQSHTLLLRKNDGLRHGERAGKKPGGDDKTGRRKSRSAGFTLHSAPAQLSQSCTVQPVEMVG